MDPDGREGIDVEYLTAEKAAEHLGISRALFWREVAADPSVLKVRMSPRTVRWRKSDLDAWAERHRDQARG